MSLPHIEPYYEGLAKRVRLLRQRTGLSQKALAECVGLSRVTITNIENGNQRLLVHTAVDIARVLGCTPEEILSEEVHDHDQVR